MSMAPQSRIIQMLTIALLVGSAASAYSQAANSHKTDTGALWMKAFAVSCANSTCRGGSENALNWDPRFHPLLQSSFHQKQFFWRDHGKFTSLPNLVQLFIGVPGEALLDNDRYVTVDGCVPHDCGDKGMLWIDTGSHPATLVFAASGMVNEDSKRKPAAAARDHLWLFASKKLNWEQLPPTFLASLLRWNQRNTMGLEPIPFILVTIVQPDGEIVDLAPTLLQLNETEP